MVDNQRAPVILTSRVPTLHKSDGGQIVATTSGQTGTVSSTRFVCVQCRQAYRLYSTAPSVPAGVSFYSIPDEDNH